jgi:hypothetical protein
MKAALATKSPKPETPFAAKVPWSWNEVPTAGIPTRSRCQRIASDDERKAAAKLISEYRAAEEISRDNNIEGKTERLNQSYRIKTMSGVEQENLRREIQKADHEKYLAAEAKLRELRKEAFVMVEKIFTRLIESLNSKLYEAAAAAEQRLDAAGLPVKNGDLWMLHDDAICKALWSCRHVAEKTLVELQGHQDGIGACQFFLTEEQGVPFQWL